MTDSRFIDHEQHFNHNFRSDLSFGNLSVANIIQRHPRSGKILTLRNLIEQDMIPQNTGKVAGRPDQMTMSGITWQFSKFGVSRTRNINVSEDKEGGCLILLLGHNEGT